MGEEVTSKRKEETVLGQDIFFSGKGVTGFYHADYLTSADWEISN